MIFGSKRYHEHGAICGSREHVSDIVVILRCGYMTTNDDHVRAEPDPLPLLRQVRADQCTVCYADFWIAYRYRFLDGERSAWIRSAAWLA